MRGLRPTCAEKPVSWRPTSTTRSEKAVPRVRLIIALVFALGSVSADEVSCTSCFRGGIDARQRGELESALRFFERGCEQNDGASCNGASYMLSRAAGCYVKTIRNTSIQASRKAGTLITGFGTGRDERNGEP